MARFLFVVPPLSGHVNPTIAVGRALRDRGHVVTWAGVPGLIPQLIGPDATFLATNATADDDPIAAAAERSQGLRGPAALKFLWADALLPLARGMLAGTEAVVTRFAPDVVVADQQALAGALVAKRRGLRWATSATTSAELTDPLADLPQVGGWVRAELHALQLEAGIDAARAAEGDLRFSPDLVLAYTTEALYGPDQPRPHGTCFVGPALAERPTAAPFPWEWLDPARPCVLVSLGTLNAEVGGRFFREAAAAIASEPLQAVLVAPPGLVPDPPDNVLVAERIPQLPLLERVSAVISHGGHNTVCETLAAGVPLVLAPIRDDQPIVAEQVVRAGAGVRVRFGRVRSAELGAALSSVLTEPGYRAAAERLQASFAAAGGAGAAADALEACARRPA